MNPWLTFTLLFLLVWTILYVLRPKFRTEMLLTSLFTMPFGLTEPLFVPEYWAPPSLFDLAARTGFDIESLLFCFAVGGIASVLYETIFKVAHKKISKKERKKHKYHWLAFASPIITFLPLYFLTPLNPIYSASVGMFVGGIAAILCRPDLKKKILIGGLMFLGLYFTFFFIFDKTYPGLVQQVWNLQALTGILILGVPIEELFFAFTFGMLWSSLYEHFFWYRVVSK